MKKEVTRNEGRETRKIVKAFCLIIFTLFLCPVVPPSLYAAASGNIQLAIASPDPATAGENITFQVIALNTGSEKWNTDEYYLEVEVYDPQKNYVNKTDRFKGKNDVSPGETVLAYIPYSVPSSFAGEYFYKVTLTVKEQKIIVSEYLPFTIIELAKPPQAPSKITVGGNAILSAKLSLKNYDISGSSTSYTHSLNMNLVGRAYQSPVSLNLYALYTKDNQFTLDNFLFNYYGSAVQSAFGDTQPAYNSLVLYGAGVRGLNLSGTKERFSASVVGAESQKKQEGTATSSGIFERYLFGARASQGLDILNSNIGVSYVTSRDDKNSIKTPGTTTPVKNNVTGLDGYFEVLKNLSVKGEYGQSKYWQDVSSSSGSVSDTGFKTTVSAVNIKNFSFTGVYSRVEPNFNSLGAPASTKDKESYEISTSYSRAETGAVSFYFNNYHDNLNSDPSKTTTTQNIGSVSATFRRGKYPAVTLGYSLNVAQGDPLSALNNRTATPSVSVSHTIKSTVISLNAQRSDFKDKTGISSNLKTDSGNLGLSTRVGRNITIASGITLSKTFNLVASTATATNSYSLNMNWMNIVPSKLSAAMWGSYTSSRDNPRQSTDNSNLTGTIEFTYNIRDNLAATLGYTHTDYNENITKTNAYEENSGNIRVSMSF